MPAAKEEAFGPLLGRPSGPGRVQGPCCLKSKKGTHQDGAVKKTLALLAALLVASLAGCLSDDSPDGPDGGTGSPGGSARDVVPYDLPESITGMEHLGVGNDVGTSGLWVEDGLAYLSGGAGLRIVDVADPANPILLAADVEDSSSRDVDLLHHPNGRLYAVLARGGAGVGLVDVTDPEDPQKVANVDASAHNIAVVPNSTLVYNSRSISTHVPEPGTTGQIDIIDFADPQNPTTTVWAFPAVAMTVGGVPKPVAATTCHDITFDAERDRAFCPGITETHVWDVSDPANPTIAQVVAWPGNQIHHGAWGVSDGSILIIGDEFAGAAAGPVCSTVDNPYAALWFFDISDLMTPLPLGYFQVEYDSAMNQNTALCTTHFGTPIEDRDLFVMGWYTAGTVLIDYSDPLMPTQVAHFRPDGDVNTWEARYWNGHVFTGDTARGMDVLRLV